MHYGRLPALMTEETRVDIQQPDIPAPSTIFQSFSINHLFDVYTLSLIRSLLTIRV